MKESKFTVAVLLLVIGVSTLSLSRTGNRDQKISLDSVDLHSASSAHTTTSPLARNGELKSAAPAESVSVPTADESNPRPNSEITVIAQNNDPSNRLEVLFTDDLTYDLAKSEITSETLPILYSRLSDPEHIDHWGHLPYLIAIPGRYAESERAILDHIARSDDPGLVPPEEAELYVYRKRNAMTPLGMVGGDAAFSFLNTAFTLEGAEALVDRWFEEHPALYDTVKPTLLTATVRGDAAAGLVLLENPKAQEAVKSEYDAMREKMLRKREPIQSRRRQTTIAQAAEEEFFDGLVLARTNLEFMESHGMEALLREHFQRIGIVGMHPDRHAYYEQFKVEYWRYQP